MALWFEFGQLKVKWVGTYGVDDHSDIYGGSDGSTIFGLAFRSGVCVVIALVENASQCSVREANTSGKRCDHRAQGSFDGAGLSHGWKTYAE